MGHNQEIPIHVKGHPTYVTMCCDCSSMKLLGISVIE